MCELAKIRLLLPASGERTLSGELPLAGRYHAGQTCPVDASCQSTNRPHKHFCPFPIKSNPLS